MRTFAPPAHQLLPSLILGRSSSATCEKQITVPGSSRLYCSERYAWPFRLFGDSDPDGRRSSCRRQDGAGLPTPTSRSSASNLSLPQLANLAPVGPDVSTKPPPNIVAPASPTARTHPSPRLKAQSLKQGSVPEGLIWLQPNQTTSSTSSSYAPSTRPLPPRQNPTSLSASPRSIELVTPLAYHPYGTVSMPSSLNHAVRWNVEQASREMAAKENTALISTRQWTMSDALNGVEATDRETIVER